MTFRPEAVPDFLSIFDESKALIRAFDGCQHLELLRGKEDPRMIFTFSQWESEQALDRYRQSELFKTTWNRTKALFAEKADAWSVELAG